MLPKSKPYAEGVPYWQTSKSAPEAWIDKAKKEIRNVGGTILGEGFLSDAQTGRSAFLLSFQLEAQRYDAKWPVLKSKAGNEVAARRQAATALYHDVKARCVALKFHGARAAFLGWLVLPDGRTAAEASDEELVQQLPALMIRQLPAPKR